MISSSTGTFNYFRFNLFAGPNQHEDSSEAMNGDVDVITPQLDKQTLEDKNGEEVHEFAEIRNSPTDWPINQWSARGAHPGFGQRGGSFVMAKPSNKSTEGWGLVGPPPEK